MKNFRLFCCIGALFIFIPQFIKADGIEALLLEAEKGNREAQTALGQYFYAKGAAQNYKEAAKWFEKAAVQDDPVAQSSLGLMYLSGQGVPKDSLKALEWYRKAADNGDSNAQYWIGSSYWIGNAVFSKHVTKDPKESFKWLSRSAEQGDLMGQCELSFCYFMGIGVPMDYVQAYKWMNLYRAQATSKCWIVKTDGSGEFTIKDIEAKITREQVAEAQRLSTAFVPKKEN